MDVYTAVRDRYTADGFAGNAPPRELVERLIETAIWAPNHHLTQPWRFTVIAGDERGKFGEALAAWMQEHESPEEEDVDRARRSMMRAPVTVVVEQVASDEPDPVLDLEDYAACCAVVQNLMLLAHAEGLTTKWATGRWSRHPGAKQLLGLSERDRIVGYVWLGYPDPESPPEERERRPAVVEWRGM